MGRPTLEFCCNGHEIAKVGRFRSMQDKYGPCKECCREGAKRAAVARVSWLQDFKIKEGCIRCGYKRSPRALDFHHRDSATKLFTIGSKPRLPWDRIKAEIAKCDVICRNCHAELHEEEAQLAA